MPVQLPLPLPSASKVTFIFDGLFFFCFRNQGPPHGDRSIWEEGQMGILPGIPDHELKVVVKAVGSSIPLFELTDSDHVPSRLLGNIIIKKIDAPGMRVERKDHGINRQMPTVDADSFKWVIDFENDELHNVKLNKDRKVLRPRLIFKDGTFCTNLVNNCAQWLIKKNSAGDEIERYDFGHVARFIGVEIPLTSGEALFIEMNRIKIKLAENSGGSPAEFVVEVSNNEDEGTPHPTGPSDIRFFYEHYLADEDGFTFEFEPKEMTCREFNKNGELLVQPFVCYGTTGSKTGQIG